jgi:hypothetical protein
MHDDAPDSRPVPSKGQPSQPLTEAELSRIAREAVHQPADARLDKQLVRMGLMDASETATPELAETTSRPVAIDPEVARLREELRRMRRSLALLIGIIAVLGILVVVLLVR